jgi:hypothetical protein
MMAPDYRNIAGGGTQPVRALQHNIVHVLENTRADFVGEIKDIVLQHGLRQGIHYEEGKIPILVFDDQGRPVDYLTASVNRRQEVVLHETFLSYLWCISYALITLFEEGNLRPARGLPPSNPSHDHVGRARQVFAYGFSLIQEFTVWNPTLPNPERPVVEDQHFIEKANGVFCEAATFVLLHEIAHVARGHTRQLGRSITDQESIAHEREADEWAIRKGFIGTAGVTNQFTKQVGVTAGVCAMMLLSRSLHGGDHPDIDERLTAAVTLLELADDSAVWAIALLGLRLWQQAYNQDIHWPPDGGSPKEYFLETMTELRRRKIAGWAGR